MHRRLLGVAVRLLLLAALLASRSARALTVAGVECPTWLPPVVITATSSPRILSVLTELEYDMTYILDPGAFRPATFVLSGTMMLTSSVALCIVGASGSAADVVIKPASASRHFGVFGSLGLANVTLDGDSTAGGIVAGAVATVGSEDVVFSRCTAPTATDTSGGAVRFTNIDGGFRARFTRTSFVDNHASNRGGAVAVLTSDPGASVTFEGPTLWRGNTAGSGGGGALFIEASSVTVAGPACILDNAAKSGGTGNAIVVHSTAVNGAQLDFQPGTAVNFGSSDPAHLPTIVVTADTEPIARPAKFTCNGTRARGPNTYSIQGPVCSPACTGTHCECGEWTFNATTCSCQVRQLSRVLGNIVCSSIPLFAATSCTGGFIVGDVDFNPGTAEHDLAVCMLAANNAGARPPFFLETRYTGGLLGTPPFLQCIYTYSCGTTERISQNAMVYSCTALEPPPSPMLEPSPELDPSPSPSPLPELEPSPSPRLRVRNCCCGGRMPSAVVLNGRWPSWHCAGLPDTTEGCAAVCATGYMSPAPTVTCSAGVWSAVSPSAECYQVCAGAPKVDLGGPGAGQWPLACTSSIRLNGWCQGVCNASAGYFGSPAVQCLKAWAVQAMGRCVKGGGCSGLPPIGLMNAVWPSSCRDSPVNTTATATCSSGFGARTAAALPQAACLESALSPTRGSWAPRLIGGQCVKLCTKPLPQMQDVVWPSSCAYNATAQTGTPQGAFCAGTARCTTGTAGGTITRTAYLSCTPAGWGTQLVGGC